MRKTIKTILIAGALLSLGIVNAQEAKEQPLKPGDVIKLDLEFRGPDADKLTSSCDIRGHRLLSLLW